MVGGKPEIPGKPLKHRRATSNPTNIQRWAKEWNLQWWCISTGYNYKCEDTSGTYHTVHIWPHSTALTSFNYWYLGLVWEDGGKTGKSENPQSQKEWWKALKHSNQITLVSNRIALLDLKKYKMWKMKTIKVTNKEHLVNVWRHMNIKKKELNKVIRIDKLLL